jgi:hypothetical protein
MAMATSNPLDIPEILTMVGKFIRLWDYYQDDYHFHPKDMLNCLQVSRHFRSTLLPIFWYTFDEEEMDYIPMDVIQQYSPLFRIYLNYGFRHQDRSTADRVMDCRRLVRLSISTKYKHLQFLRYHDVDFIKANPGLELLEDFYFDPTYNTSAITKLRSLKYLKLHVNSEEQHHSLGEAFQHISTTLEILCLDGAKGISCLKGLALPNLSKLLANFSCTQETMDILHQCPNLVNVGTSTRDCDSSFALLGALKSGACPTLKRLQVEIAPEQENVLIEALESRTGLQQLVIDVEHITERISRAIGHHGSSLTYLAVSIAVLRQVVMTDGVPVLESPLSGLIPALKACGHLRDVVIDNVKISEIEDLLSKDHWKNPEVLETIAFTCDNITRLANKIERFCRKNILKDPPPPPIVCPNGWRELSESQEWDYYTERLESVFRATEDFVQLRLISVDEADYVRD